MNKDQEDKIIIRRFLEGDRKAFDELVLRHQRDVHMLALRIVRDHNDALDISQKVFIRAHSSLRNFRGDSSLTTWLYRITYNLSVKHLSAGKWKRFLSLEEGVESLPSTSNPAREMERREFQQELEKALKELPPRQRAVFAMRQLQGLKIDEVAEILGRKPGTIKALHFQAVNKLRRVLKEWRHTEFAA